MLVRRVALAAVALVATAGSGDARGENCVDKEVARTQGGRPCMDLGTSMGQLEVWRAPGFLDVRISAVRLALYGNDPARRGTGFELVTWEAIGDGDELEHPRDLGDRSALQLLTLRRQRDTEHWGVYVAGDLVTRWFGHTRGLTPRLGLRLGRFDRAAIVLEATLAGAFVLGDYDRWSLTDDVDVTGRATLAVARRLRLEARGRYRDLEARDGRALRDVTAAVGVELEASPPSAHERGKPNTWRVMTLFAGVALRRALVDVDPDDPSPIAAAAHAATRASTTTTTTTTTGGPWQLMVWLDLDFAINSQRTIW